MFDTNEPSKDIINEIAQVSQVKRAISNKNINSKSFIDLVSKEFSSVKKCNRVIKKLEKYVFSDEFIFSLETKDLIKLMEVVLKYKHTSLNFLAKLYDVATKNELLRTYFEDKDTSKPEVFKQDARVRDIVAKIKMKTKEKELEQESNER